MARPPFLNRVRSRSGLWLLIPGVLLPMLWAVGYSLLYSFGVIGFLSAGPTLTHWRSAVTEGNVLASLAFSIAVAAAATAAVTALALAVLIVDPPLRHQPLLLLLACLLMGTPSAIIAFLTAQFLSAGGLAARLLFHAGRLESPDNFPRLVNDAWGIGITVALICNTLPLTLLYFSQLWDTIAADQRCRLAESLGAAPLEARRKVALPMLLQRGRSMIVLIFLLVLGSYETPLLLGRQSPQMISVFTQQQASPFDLGSKPQMFALATLYFLLCSLLLTLYLRGRRHAE